MKIHQIVASSILALAAAGCFTVHHSPFPEVEMSRRADGRDIKVALSGFEAMVTSYTPIHTQTTAWSDGPDYIYGRRGRHYGYAAPRTETWSSTTYLPQEKEDHTFINFATDALEANGFIIATTNADYVVDVSFSGPVVTNGDRVAEAMWIVLSLLSADYTAEEWSARLKIRENATGKVLLMRDYSEKCTVAVWGPIPIFSPISAQDSSSSAVQSWTLSALTSRAMADATAFLASVQ